MTLNLNLTPTLTLTHVKVRAFFQEFRALLLRMENVHKLQTSACLCCYKILPTLHTVNFVMMLVLNLVMIAEPFTFIEHRYAVSSGFLDSIVDRTRPHLQITHTHTYTPAHTHTHTHTHALSRILSVKSPIESRTGTVHYGENFSLEEAGEV